MGTFTSSGYFPEVLTTHFLPHLGKLPWNTNPRATLLMPEIDGCSSCVSKPLRKGFPYAEGRTERAPEERESQQMT